MKNVPIPMVLWTDVETGQMSSVETGEMSVVETGQTIGTRQMSAVET